MIGHNLNLWRNVTLSGLPKELVDYNLKEAKDSIVEGILAYDKHRNADSEKEVKSTKWGENQLQFIMELSELLGIDQLLCQKLFMAWLTNEYRDTSEHLTTCLSDERSRYSLLERLVTFYYADRMYSHFTLRHLVSESHNPQHPLQPVYAEFVESLEEKAAGHIYTLLVSQYNLLVNTEPVELYNSPLRHIQTKEFTNSWCYKVLKEQILVLETLLIHLYHTTDRSSSQPHLDDLLIEFKARALTGQPPTALKHLIDDVHRPLVARLEHLQVLVLLTLMRLNSHSSAGHVMNEKTPTLKKLDSLFESRLGDFPSHGPLVLGWAVVRCGQVHADYISRLGDVALGSNVFAYILQLLDDLEPQETSNQLSVQVIYHLIARVLQLFDESALDDSATLTGIICQLVKHESVANLVIQRGGADSIYRYILTAINTFPLNFYSSLSMLTSLARSSKQAAIHVVRLLVDVPTFTEYLDTNSQTNLQFISENQVELLEARPLFGSMQLPSGCVGEIHGSEGLPSVQWRHPFNAWDLLACELATVCSQPYLMADSKVQERIMANTNLMAATFKHAPISGPPAEIIHDSLYRILLGLASLETPPLDTIASCLDLAASLSVFTPATVVENLSTGFFPFLLNLANDLFRPSEAEIEKSLLGQILYSTECTQSRYPVLISTMKLIYSTLHSSQHSNSQQIVRQRLLPVAVYMIRTVLPSHLNWRYRDVVERDIIGEMCIELIHVVLNTACTNRKDSLSEACVRTLLHTNSSHSILDMISFGTEVLDLVILEQYSLQVASCMTKKGKPSAVYKLTLCLSVLKRLLMLAQDTKETTSLESCLSTQGNASQCHIARIISSYTYHRHHTRLAVISTQLLNVIAQESRMSLLSSFGEDAHSIRSGFLRRLALRSEDPQFKVVLIELLTTCVAHQPGLLELFLSGKAMQATSLLDITQEMISVNKQFTHLCPGHLLLAAFNFVLALWTSGRQRVTQQLSDNKAFWEAVVSPLTKMLGPMGTTSDTHPLKAKLYCNVLQLLAYQLYQRDSSLNEFHSALENVTQSQWQEICTFLHKELKAISNPPDESTLPADKAMRYSSAVHLLDSYRMFISTMWLAESSLFKQETRLSVMNQVLDTLSHTLSGELTPVDQRLASMLSSLYFELLTQWSSHFTDWASSYHKLAQALHASTNDGADIHILPPTLVGILASLQLICSQKLQAKSSIDSTLDSTQTILSCVCNLIPACNMKLSSLSSIPSTDTPSLLLSSPPKEVPCADALPLQQLRVVLLSCLFELIEKLPESLWISKLHESFVIQSLFTTVAHCVKTQTDLMYVESCVSLFTKLSFRLSTSKLIAQPLSEHLTLAATVLYPSASISGSGGDIDLGGRKSDHSWHKILSQITDIYSLLLNNLAHSFVVEAACYVSVHSERILSLSETLTVSIQSENLLELKSYMHLIGCLSKHQPQWMSESGRGRVRRLLAASCYVSQDCVALLNRPRAIQLMLFKESKQNNSQKPHFIDISQTRQRILELLAESCTIMKSFTPDLFLLLHDVTFDVMSFEPLVVYGFTSPALESLTPPSFGTLISMMTICISLLTKSERSPSRCQVSDDEVDSIKTRLLYVLEVTLYLTLSQVLLYLRSSLLDAKETNLLKREVASELNACILGIQRYYRKLSPASPSQRGATTLNTTASTPTLRSQSSSKSPRARSMHSPGFTASIAEHGLYKFADQFVRSVLK